MPPQPPVPDRRGTGYYEKDLEGEAGLPVRNPDSEPKVADPKRAGTEASSSSTPRSKEGSVKVDQAPSMEMAMGEEESDLLVDKMIQLAKATATRFGVTSEQLLDAVQLTWLPALEQKLWRTTETCLLCSHSPGNLREWQQHLLTKSHSRIANEAKMTWYHLYLVMSIHDDRMHPGLPISIAFAVSTSFETCCECRAPSPIPPSGAAKQGNQHRKPVRMSPALCHRMRLCFSSSWLKTSIRRNDAQFGAPLGGRARQMREVPGAPDLPTVHPLSTLNPAHLDKQPCHTQGGPRMHNSSHDFQPRVAPSPDRSRWRTHRWKIRTRHRRPRASGTFLPLLVCFWSHTC